jgi:hypothetical protein
LDPNRLKLCIRAGWGPRSDLKHDSQTSFFEHSAGAHNPEIHALLLALAAFSEKGKNLRLIIKTGGVVDVHQRPEETNRQSLSARRRESLLEHSRRAPVNVPEQDLMRPLIASKT